MCLLIKLVKLVVGLSVAANVLADGSSMPKSADVKKILDSRCVVCHGCYDAPCQLKLGSYDGLLRGATSQTVYNPSRLSEDITTRLFVDGQSVTDWRRLGFHEVITSGMPSTGGAQHTGDVLARLINVKSQSAFPAGRKLPENFPLDINRELSCSTKSQIDDFLSINPEAGMPYGMAPLPPQELAVLKSWIKQGYPNFEKPMPLPADINEQVRQWELFFNQSSVRHKLVARYLYEHLFLGHLAISDKSGKSYYFRIIRSSTPIGLTANEIAMRRPNSDPGEEAFYYRLIPIMETILDKTHIVFSLTPQRLEHWFEIFFAEKWAVKKLPDYSVNNANNPFLTFSAIPAEARYRFMLDNVRFFVESFIKGPVCRGQVALNVINDYFFVAFLSPEYDLSVVDKSYLANAIPFLDLPPTSAGPLEFATLWHEGLHSHRRYLEYRDEAYRTHEITKKGLPLSAIWKGDATSISQLTVFRHFDSASVSEGFIGEGPNTVWVIDYPTLERIYYDLVVNFDVFGSVSHQILTRMYMDYLRMESEALFLSFLPVADREPILKHWYRGALAQAKVFYGHSHLLIDTPAAIHYGGKDPKNELIRMIGTRSMRSTHSARPTTNYVPSDLKVLDNLSAKKSLWLRYLPELSYVVVHDDHGEITNVISMVVNRAHANVSFIFGEEDRRIPEEDTLMLVNGLLGSYPNFIFWIDQSEIGKFADAAKQVSDTKSMDQWVARYGVRRTDPRIWSVLDRLHYYKQHYYKQKDGESEGLLDVSRYENL